MPAFRVLFPEVVGYLRQRHYRFEAADLETASQIVKEKYPDHKEYMIFLDSDVRMVRQYRSGVEFKPEISNPDLDLKPDI